MPDVTVCVAVISEGQILLTQRDDFEVWCLPSGGVELGESVAQAAIRETKEETGLDVELKSVVGIYSRLGSLPDTHSVLFSAVPVGGKIQTQPGETIDVRFFPLNKIPENLIFGHRKRILDAIGGFGGGMAVTEEVVAPMGQKISYEEIDEVRKLPREDRLEFYERTLGQAEIRIKNEVGKRR